MNACIDACTVERIKLMWSHERLVERSLSTDDLETFFGTIVVHCQYKPQLVALSGGMRNIEYRTKLRRTAQEQLGFSISSSRSSKYAQSAHTAQKNATHACLATAHFWAPPSMAM